MMCEWMLVGTVAVLGTVSWVMILVGVVQMAREDV